MWFRGRVLPLHQVTTQKTTTWFLDSAQRITSLLRVKTNEDGYLIRNA
jgi:hypothetical protein